MTIPTGGEPLPRRDILGSSGAAERGLWCRRHQRRAHHGEPAARRRRPAQGSSFPRRVDPDATTAFRGGAWRNTVEGAEIPAGLAPSSCRRPPARTIRRARRDRRLKKHDRPPPRSTSTLGADGPRVPVSGAITPAQHDEVPASLYRISEARPPDAVNAKCAPHYIKICSENAAFARTTWTRFGAQADLRARRSKRTRRGLRRLSAIRPTPEAPAGARRGRLHGDPAERGRHAVSLPPGLR